VRKEREKERARKRAQRKKYDELKR